MKESVAKAYSYLTHTLGLDVSIIDVEIVLNMDSILETDGCLVSCFLDAGCAAVVVRVKQEDDNEGGLGLSKALEACDVARVPRERLILHCKNNDDGLMLHQVINRLDDVRARVGTVSVQIMDLASSDSAIDSISGSTAVSSSTKSDDVKWVIQLTTNNNNNNNHDEELLSKVTSKYSQVMGDNRGSITLVDPTPEQLGLCYASCLKTDRSDGLFTTVVCTRSNEALGLVYSSKVSVCVFVCLMCCSIFKTVVYNISSYL